MKGSITVFMSMCLAVFLLFVGTVLESARAALLQNQLQRGAEAAMDSLFSQYDGDLFDQFGILMLNTEDLPDFQGMDELLLDALKQEMDLKEGRITVGGNLFREQAEAVQVLDVMPATAMEGELFARSVLEYMKYRLPTVLVQEAAKELALVKQGEEAKGGRTDQTEEIEQQLPKGEGQAGKAEEAIQGSILGKVKALKENGFMELVLPAGYTASQKRTTKSDFPSNNNSGSGTAPSNLTGNLLNNLMFCEYALEYLSDFTRESSNEVLQYELEYVIYGSGIDRENLKGCIEAMLLLREGMNIMTIYQNSYLEAQADAFAAALVGWTGIAPLVEAVKAAAVGAWAYGEAVTDVRALLGGGQVPLLKQGDEWYLTLTDLPKLLEGKVLGTRSYESGLDYQDYLRIMLLMTNEKDKYYRVMDMIQCRLSSCKPRFYLKECAYAVAIRADASVKPLFPSLVGYRGALFRQYELQVYESRMY